MVFDSVFDSVDRHAGVGFYYKDLFRYLAGTPLEFLVSPLLLLSTAQRTPHLTQKFNLRSSLVKILNQIPNISESLGMTCPNILEVLHRIPSAFIRQKYKYEKQKLKKKLSQCVAEYSKLNQIRSKYNVIVSREYDLVNFTFSYIAYKNKDGSAINVSGWKGDSKYYILMDKREFNTHPPSKLFCYMPSNNVSNIFQLILSDAYKAYPKCRFSSRYNRKMKNYWIETQFGNYPKEVNKDDNTSYT